jgi:hypothetical protein
LYDDLTEEDLEITDLKAGYPPGQLPQTAEASDAIPDTTVSMPPMAYHLFSDLPIQSGKSSDYTVTSTDRQQRLGTLRWVGRGEILEQPMAK